MTRLIWIKAAMASILVTFSALAIAAESPQEVPEQLPQVQLDIQLDINEADAATIAQALDGVGMVKAQEIVAYRDMFGKFESVEELAEVQGIGAVTVEKNRARIIIVKN